MPYLNDDDSIIEAKRASLVSLVASSRVSGDVVSPSVVECELSNNSASNERRLIGGE